MIRSKFLAITSVSLIAGSGMISLLAPQNAWANTSSNSSTHFFNVFVNPLNQFKVNTSLKGYAASKFGPYSSYNSNAQWIGPLGIGGVAGPKTAFSQGCAASASAASNAWFNSGLFSPGLGIFSGGLTASATATANSGCGRTWANAGATARINIYEGKANKFGQIRWKPRFSDGVSAFANAVYDPVSINFFDPSGNPLLNPDEGKLLSVKTIMDEIPFTTDPTSTQTLDWGDTALIGNLFNGSFEIDASNPLLSDPGILRIGAKDGLVVEKIATGRFAVIDALLPRIGDAAQINVPFSADFPDEIPLNYDFTPRISDPVVDASYDLDGGVTVDAPGPLPVLGIGVGFGYSRRLRQRIKNSQS